MKTTELKSAVKMAVQIKEPLMIWGQPGIGKSSVIKQVADDLEFNLIDLRAVLLDPVDLRGVPSVEGGITKWCPPSFLPTSGEGILFIDELPQAPRIVQNAFSQLILDGQIGEYFMPEGWRIVAAGNEQKYRAATEAMPTHIANRFIHVTLEVDLDSWVQWANVNNIDPSLIGFLRFRPELLSKFDPAQDEKAQATPRTWEKTSRIVQSNNEDAITFDMIRGTVGEGAATEYAAFLKIYRHLPDLDDVIKNPDKAKLPEDDPATMYAITAALSAKVDKKNFAAILRYINRMPKEYGVLGVRDAIYRDESLCETSEFGKWAKDNSEVII